MDDRFLSRGKRIDNGEWVIGYYFEHLPPLVAIVTKDYIPKPSTHWIVITGNADWNMPRPKIGYEVALATIEQCTGLKDKNGTLIFEGDKLFSENMLSYCTGKDDERFAVVQWDNNHDAHYIGNMRTTCYNLSASKFHECEIIGNIHDTPDLVQCPQHRE